jgi:formate hydrogenlyase subunit 3/multisubunit Na+/H+ antiporter MnhD subunit
MKYSKFKNIYVGLLLTLTGLPPFILFFVKFNYLLEIFYKLNFMMCAIVYIMFFLNMLFYIQSFLNKKTNSDKIFYKKQLEHYNYKILYFII